MKYQIFSILLCAALFNAGCKPTNSSEGVAEPFSQTADSVEQSNVLPKSTNEAIETDMPRLLAEYKIPSVSIATIKDGQVSWSEAYGERKAGAEASPDSLYNIASLTKPISAEIVLRLASEGKLSLDESMDPYWSDPDLKDDLRRKALTPRIALTHQTGFPNWRNSETGLAFDRDPGTAWGYSGEGYQYVTNFAAAKVKKPFEKLAEDYLFDPIDMTTTSYTGQSWFEGRIAVPHDINGSPLAPMVADDYNAADLVYTTAGEYASFMVSVLNDEAVSPEIAIQRNQIQISMVDMTCSGEKAQSCPQDVGFGLGWQLLMFDDGPPVMMHTGKDAGVFTFAFIDRGRKEDAVILTNGENGYKIILPTIERLDVRPEFLRFLRGQIE